MGEGAKRTRGVTESDYSTTPPRRRVELRRRRADQGQVERHVRAAGIALMHLHGEVSDDRLESRLLVQTHVEF